MGPPKTVRTIWQGAFDEVMKQNMEDLGMDPAEALQDSIQTLTLQGVDLSGVPSNTLYNCFLIKKLFRQEFLNAFQERVVCLDGLKQLAKNWKDQISKEDINELLGLFDKLIELCSGSEGSGNAAIVTKNGRVAWFVQYATRLKLSLSKFLFPV